jgi:hypothetical protein
MYRLALAVGQVYRRDHQHRVQSALNPDVRRRASRAQRAFNVLQLPDKVLRASLFDMRRGRFRVAELMENRVAPRLKTAVPFGEAPIALDARPFARRLRDHILNEAPGQTGLRHNIGKAQPIVVDNSVPHEVERGGNLDNSSAAACVGEMLP